MDEQACILSVKNLEQPYHPGPHPSHVRQDLGTLYLRDINLELVQGEIFGIIGPRYSGKSALLQCISLLERPASGIIAVDKLNYSMLLGEELRLARKHLGFVSQNPSLIVNKTVSENIALPLEFQNFSKAENHILLKNVMQLTALTELSQNYPSQLSWLQQQKVALARAIVTKPKLLLCDGILDRLEHSAMLHMIQLLKEINLSLQTTIVITTQQVEIIKLLCRRVALMHKGQMLETSSVFQFITHPQSKLAQQLIRQATKLEMPASYRRKLKTESTPTSIPVCRIIFPDAKTPEINLRSLIEKLHIRLTILQAHQEIIQNKMVKFLLAEMHGSKENLEQAQTALQTQGLFLQVVGYLDDFT
jgi:D-methionine transport system ATP-binding protein